MNTDTERANASATALMNTRGVDAPITPETDDDPATGPDKAVVDEDGLAGGIHGGVRDALTEQTVETGVLGYDAGDDGLGGFTWHTDGLPALTSGGDPVSWRLNGNGRSLVGFDGNGDRVISVQLTDVASGSYKVAVAQPLDHTYAGIEDDLNFSVGYTISDADGDSADGVLRVTVDDDSGRANDDIATTTIGTSVTLDVLDNDAFGADGSGGVVAASVQGGASVGSVNVNGDDTLTFVPGDGFTGSALIDYTMQDRDGDASDGQLTVTVEGQRNDVPTTPETDGDPATGPAKAVVDEDGLAGGIHGGVRDALTEQTVETGVLGYDAGDDGLGGFTWHTDGLPALTSGGDPVSWRLNGNGRSLVGFDGNGDRVISVQLTDVASGSYKVAVAQPLDHTYAGIEDDLNFSVGYTVTDRDGDSASGVLRITVDDDSPQVSDGSATTGTKTPVTVDVLANDAFGADGSGGVVAASVQGGASVGSVSVNGDDTLTFVPGDGFTGSALIDYSASDGDGDTSEGRLTVTVRDPQGNGIPTTPSTPPWVLLDEDGLVDGIGGGPGDIPDPAGTSYNGQLGYDFGDDGPGSFTWLTEDLPTLTSRGSSIDWQLSDDGLVLRGAADGRTVIRFELTDVLSGDYQVWLEQSMDHDDAYVESNIDFDIGYRITDGDGDSAASKIQVRVNDDSPFAVASMEATIESGSKVFFGNVLRFSRSGADYGLDFSVEVQGGDAVGSVSTTSAGFFFTAHPDFTGIATVYLNVIDGDGSIDVDDVSITVESNVDTGDYARANSSLTPVVVAEDGLADGITDGGDDAPGESSIQSGSLPYDFGSVSVLEAEAQDDVLGNALDNAQTDRLALSELLDDESDEEVSVWLPPEQDQTDSVGPASAGGSGGGSGGGMDSGADSEQALALNGAGAGDTTLERIGQEAALLVE
ncbi:Ig-like domain-containing protein [Halomonas sp. H33-56]|uniref:Ig-like domain-containing protein n=1 Tax=Halomonas sp. RT37 TaxID=2950872 RepID=A0AAU7KEA0_9GAMM